MKPSALFLLAAACLAWGAALVRLRLEALGLWLVLAGAVFAVLAAAIALDRPERLARGDGPRTATRGIPIVTSDAADRASSGDPVPSRRIDTNADEAFAELEDLYRYYQRRT